MNNDLWTRALDHMTVRIDDTAVQVEERVS